jgi:hypothetical protein
VMDALSICIPSRIPSSIISTFGYAIALSYF